MTSESTRTEARQPGSQADSRTTRQSTTQMGLVLQEGLGVDSACAVCEDIRRDSPVRDFLD